MKKVFFVLLFSPLISTGQSWDMKRDGILYVDTVQLSNPPEVLDFTLGVYEAKSRVKYTDGVVYVGSIRWKGTALGTTVVMTIEEAAYRKNGKIRGSWLNMEHKILKAIKDELAFYESK